MLRITCCRRSILWFAVVLAPALLAAMAPSRAVAQASVVGEWSDKFDTVNVMVHASLLPNGKVLFWSRREVGETLDPHVSTPRIWDPALGRGLGAFSETANKPGFNLFCSGHTFLPDGRLFVVGGHLSDFHGSPQATIYDPASNTWIPAKDTKDGRWYPTAVTLADGGVLVSSGGTKDGVLNESQQIWKDGDWTEIVNFGNPPLYPRMHVLSNARVFMSGPNARTQFLDTSGAGNWTPLADRAGGFREYAPSVLYDVDKVAFIGGGDAPSDTVETIDLGDPMARWKRTDSMNFRRRQHNATLLPDGTILVMGGTKGGGFNDLASGSPIRSAELWDPKTGHWTKLAQASVDRCYHSTAVLLPDATVLNAGGGEFRPNVGEPSQASPFPGGPDRENLGKDTHKDAQIFSPPYLFRGGVRPDITTPPPSVVTYGQKFAVGTSHPDQVGQVNWIRLSSVTHSFNVNQRINFLKFTADATSLEVTAPANAKLCPPGHYMLFVLDKKNVPSGAKIIRIH